MSGLLDSGGLLLVVSLVAGLGLGLIYFGGLWYTIQAMQRSTRPGVLFFASFLVRLAVVLGAIYWIGLGDWRRMVAALVGMIAMRMVLTRRLGPPGKIHLTPRSRAGEPGQSG